MKVLLINPPTNKIIYAQLPKFLIERDKSSSIFGLMYLASYLRFNSHHHVKILDCSSRYKGSIYDIKSFISSYAPDLIGITGHTINWIDILDLAKLIKATLPEVHLTLGGAHATMFPLESLNFSYFDSIVVGEGEKPLLELCNTLEQEGKLPRDCDIKGVITKGKTNFILSEELRDIEDLDSLPFPDRENIVRLKKGNLGYRNEKVTFMIGSRGCPFDCMFCSKLHKKYRARSVKNIVDEMVLCEKRGYRYIVFYDETLNVPSYRLIELSEEILRRNVRINWSINARIDYVDKKALSLAKQAGCKIIGYGIETASEKGLKMLKNMEKITLEKIKKAFYLTKKVGIKTVAFFLIGTPYDRTREDIMHTIKFAKKLNPDSAIFSVLVLYPDTALYRIACQKGIILGNEYKNFILNSSMNDYFPVWKEFFSPEYLYKMLNYAYLSFYFSPVRIFRRIISGKASLSEMLDFWGGCLKV